MSTREPSGLLCDIFGPFQGYDIGQQRKRERERERETARTRSIVRTRATGSQGEGGEKKGDDDWENGVYYMYVSTIFSIISLSHVSVYV